MQMSGKDNQILTKIKSRLDRIMKYGHGCEDYDDFVSDKMRVEACIFNLMQIGELAKQGLSDEVKNNISNVKWKQVCSMKEHISMPHNEKDLDTDMDKIDSELVWKTVSEEIPILREKIKKVLDEA